MSSFEEQVKSGAFSSLMEDIKSLLTSKGMTFSASQSEIVIQKQTKKKVCKLMESLPVPASTLKLLLDVVETNKNVYVRKRVNF